MMWCVRGSGVGVGMVAGAGQVTGVGDGRSARRAGSVRWSSRIGEWGGRVSVGIVIERMSVRAKGVGGEGGGQGPEREVVESYRGMGRSSVRAGGDWADEGEGVRGWKRPSSWNPSPCPVLLSPA